MSDAHDTETLADHRICNARYGQVTCYCSAIEWMTLDQYGEHIEALAAVGRAQGARDALREARDAWQWGQWADAPRCADRVQERIANAQYVTDWLTARLEALTDEGSSS